MHKSIIWLTLKEKTDTFLNKLNKHNFDANSIELVLFYCYSGCLPLRLDLKAAAGAVGSSSPQASASSGGPTSSAAAASASDSNMHELLSLGDEARLKSLVQFLQEYDELNDLNDLLRVYMNNFSFKLS